MNNRLQPIRRSIKYHAVRVMRGAALAEYLPILSIGLLSAMAGYERYGDTLSDHVSNMADQLASNYYQGWFYPEGTSGLAPMGGGHSNGGGSPGDQGSGSDSQDPTDPSNHFGDGSVTNPIDPNDPFNPGGGGPSCAATGSGDGFGGLGGNQGGFSPVPSTGSTNAFAGNPIDFGTGNKFQREADYRDFRSMPLEFVRYYNSFQSNSNLGLGYGWRHSYQRRLVAVDTQGRSDLAALPGADSERIKVVRDDGSIYLFHRQGDTWQGQSVVDRLEPIENGWRYETVNKYQETYTLDGRLQKIEYPNGVVHTLTYEEDRLAYVADNRGPRIDLHYQNGWVNRVNLPSGQQLNFKYDEKSNLAAYKISRGGIWSKIKSGLTGDEARYHYESDFLPHGLTGKTDAEGKRYATWAYDQLGRANLSEHAEGVERLRIEYRSDTEVAITNIAGLTSVMHLEPARPGYRRLVRVDGEATPSCGATRKHNYYDQQGFLKLAVDTEGTGLRLLRNNRGLITQQDNGLKQAGEQWLPTEGTQRVERQWHNQLPLPVQVIHSRYTQSKWQPYLRTDIRYDAAGRMLERTATDLLSKHQPQMPASAARTWQYTYTMHPKVVGVISELNINGPRKPLADGSDDIYIQRFNESGLLTQLQNPLGHITNFESHNRDGLPVSAQLPDDLRIELSYDDHGNLIEISRINQDQRVTYRAEYDRNHLLVRLELPDGSSNQLSYNDARQLIQVENNWGEVRDIEPSKINGNWTAQLVYNRDGKLVRQYERSLDSLGRVLSQLGQHGQQTTFDYTGSGQLKSVKRKGDAQSQRYHYDSLRRLSHTIDALGGQTQFSYAPSGGVETITDANGATTVYTYNGFGERVKLDSPDTGILVTEYDAAGNKSKARGAQSGTEGINYRYDALNRLVMIDRPGDKQDVHYRYDQQDSAHGVGLGRLTQIKDASGTIDYRYDAAGNVLEDLRRFTLNGEATAYSLRYEYTLANQLAAVIYPNGQRVTYSYDADRLQKMQLHTASNSEVLIDNIRYQAFGAIAQWQYGNELQQIQSFDADGRLQRNSLKTGDHSPLWDNQYQFDQRNNIVGIVDDVISVKQTFQYDALDRLTQDHGYYGNKVYRYDPVGNRLSRSVNASEYRTKIQSPDTGETNARAMTDELSYHANSNRLQRYGDTDLLMSENGNTLIEHNQDWDRRYIYNLNNQVVASYLNQTFAGSYAYNALGQRTHKMVTKPEGNIHTVFHYGLSGQLLGETQTNQQTGQQQHKNYVWLDRKPVAMLDGDQVVYLHTDHLNTPRMATNLNQDLVWRWHSDAFGEGRAQEDPDGDGQLTQINLRFAGQYHDRESGLYYNYHRYYDPKQGRYTQSDPIGLQTGVNTFAYVNADPLHNTDPLGLFLFAFDGTGQDRGNSSMGPVLTNVAILQDYYDVANNSASFYQAGVGTGGSWDQFVGGGFGAGARARVDQALEFLDGLIRDGDVRFMDGIIDIIGFSRGSAIAREFSNDIYELIDSGHYDRLYAENPSTSGNSCVISPSLQIRFLGLFDTVGSLGVAGDSDNGDFNLAIDSRISHVAHAVAVNEHRSAFSLSSVEGDEENPGSVSNIVEHGFIGAHTDIGGGYGDGDLSDVALQWMYKQASGAGVELGSLSREHREIARPVLHDERTGDQGYLYPNNDDRKIFYENDPDWIEAECSGRAGCRNWSPPATQRQLTAPQFQGFDHMLNLNPNGNQDNVRGTVDMNLYREWLISNRELRVLVSQ